MFRFTANGRDVSVRVSRIWRRTTSMSANQGASVPNPPALLTAAARRGPAAIPIGARMIGTSMPSLSHSAVFIEFLPVAALATALARTRTPWSLLRNP